MSNALWYKSLLCFMGLIVW